MWGSVWCLMPMVFFSEKHEFNPPDNQAQKIKTSRPDTPRFKHIKGPWVAEKFPGQFPKVCNFL